MNIQRALRISGVAFAMFIAPITVTTGAIAQDAPDVISVRSDDRDMNAAIARAKSELPTYYARMKSPKPDDDGFSVKFNLDPGGDTEFIWAGNLTWTGKVLTGTLNNVPVNDNFTQGQRVTIAQKDIIDWSYWDGTTVQGEYTTRVLLPQMSSEMAEQVRKNNNW